MFDSLECGALRVLFDADHSLLTSFIPCAVRQGQRSPLTGFSGTENPVGPTQRRLMTSLTVDVTSFAYHFVGVQKMNRSEQAYFIPEVGDNFAEQLDVGTADYPSRGTRRRPNEWATRKI